MTIPFKMFQWVSWYFERRLYKGLRGTFTLIPKDGSCTYNHFQRCWKFETNGNIENRTYRGRSPVFKQTVKAISYSLSQRSKRSLKSCSWFFDSLLSQKEHPGEISSHDSVQDNKVHELQRKEYAGIAACSQLSVKSMWSEPSTLHQIEFFWWKCFSALPTFKHSETRIWCG